METENSEVLDAPQTPQQEEIGMEKQGKLETAKPKEPENPPAAVEETAQLAPSSHAAEVVTMKEVEDNKGKIAGDNSENPDVESVPCSVVPPKPDESSDKVTDPAVALDIKPENTEQQSVTENKPEPVQMQLADSAPEPEPAKLAESVPAAEVQEQALPAQAAAQPSADEKVETEKKQQTAMEAKAGGESAKTVAAAAVEKEASAEVGSGESEQAAKEVDAKKASPVKPAEAGAEGEGVKSVPEGAEPLKDDVPAPGSLAFALLDQEETKNALRVSRTLVVLRGLPGSGKSLLARAIADCYKDNCCVICADEHGVKPESPESSADGFKALDEAVVARCSEGSGSSLLVVVDDTNHAHNRLARLGEIAEEHHLVAIFLEPQTEWSRDPAQLLKKTQRALKEAQVEAMKAPLEETSLPLFFGWFLMSSVLDKIRCSSMDFLKTLDTLESFKKNMASFTGKAEEVVDLEEYFSTKGARHCTTKFCDYGKAEGAKEYAQNADVQRCYGSVSELSLTALFVTPRTCGARVSLTDKQLLLWPADAEKEAESTVPGAASLPLGSRAHVTLGYAEGVDPVQTGLDLLQILVLQKEGQQGEVVEEMELGSLAYFGEGRWLLSLREPICASACFSSFYGQKEVEPTKKDPEKKKKPKCSIL